jgi:predicted metalloprotease with PDZ domain
MERKRAALLAAVTLLGGGSLAAQTRRVEYEIAFPKAAQHEAEVTATFVGVPAGTPLRVRMSRASPGRYAITQFAKNVYDVRATDARGRALAVTRPDPHGWDVRGHHGTVKVSYTVWGDRADGTYLQVDASHAHLNMPATFVWARGFDAAPVRLTVHPRAGWHVATQLVPTADSTVFTAPSVVYFMDSPTEVGPITWRTWETRHDGRVSTWRLAIHHLGGEAEVDSFTTMAQRIVAEQVASWGEPPTLDHGVYTFIADYLPWANGDAMEHRNSTFLTGRSTLAERANQITKLGSLSHELFHAWNGERLRARSLEPFDLERENMSGELWFAEGFTSYFDDLFIRRAGYYTDDEYVRTLVDDVIGTIDAPARAHGSAVDMSRLAPFFDGGSYLDPTNRQNTFLSYYTWGAAIGLALDLTLRAERGTTLEDFMRAMWRNYGRAQTPALAPARPYTLTDLRTTLGRVTRDTAFANEFFRRYIEGRDVPDFARLLARAGILLAADSVQRPYLGGSLDDDPNAVFVNWSVENGSLYQAGIVNGDVIHALDGVATTSSKALDSLIAGRKVGDVVQLDVTQRGQRKTVSMTLRGLPRLRLVTYESAGRQVTDEMRTFRGAWFGSRAGER